MYNFIKKTFVKNYTNKQSQETRTSYGIVAGIIGLITNLILFALKIVVGLLTLSITIISDAVNNLTDFLSSILIIMGFKISSKPADERHPYGYARFEYITSLIMAVIIVILGMVMLVSSINKIINPSVMHIGIVSIIILSSSILFKLFLFGLFKSFAKDTQSPVLTTACKDTRNDAISAIIIFCFALCLLIWGESIAILDGIFGCLVCLLIIYSGIQMIRDYSSSLIGTGGTDSEIEKIKQYLYEKDFVLDVHNVQFHKYGAGTTYVNAHIGVDGNIPLIKCNELVNQLEEDIEKEYNIDITLHVDAIDRNNKATVLFKNKINNILKEIDEDIEIDHISVVEKPMFIVIDCDIILPLDCEVDIQTLQNVILTKFQSYKKDVVLNLNET